MKRRRVCIAFWAFVVAVGISIVIYPSIRRFWQESEQQKLIRIYLQGQLPSEKLLQNKNMLGVLWIPKVECLLPVFEGTEETVLEAGAGLLEGSSGISDEGCVHTVLCAHSGLPQMYAFDRIDLLEEGDAIYVLNHECILVYNVTSQSTVMPEEVHLLLQPSQFANQITLLTCTPYGVNTHRLLVQAGLSRSLRLSGLKIWGGGNPVCKKE